MKYLLYLFTLSFSVCSYAQSTCQANKQVVGATYQISLTNPTTGKSLQKPQIIHFWRDHDQVIYEYNTQEITEEWRLLKNNHVQLIRYFDHYQRGIEYQPADLHIEKMESSWEKKEQILNQKFIDQLVVEKKIKTACSTVSTFKTNRGKTNTNNLIALSWDNSYHLPTKLTTKQDNKLITWTLQKLITDPLVVKQNFTKRDDFELTDYTDIGDNESDPFLAKMINQGFISHHHSGFYNTDGEHL